MMYEKNPVFNPALYVCAGGVIEDFDPAKDSIRRARIRSMNRMKEKELEIKRRKKEIKKRKLKKQRLLGLCALILAAFCFVIGFMVMEEMIFIGIMIGLGSLIPLLVKEVIL